MRTLFIASMLLAANLATATTITFENATGGYYDGASCIPAEDSGFRFSTLYGTCAEIYNLTAPGSTTSLHTITHLDTEYVMEAISGESFSLHSIDSLSLGGPSVVMTGHYSGGGTVQTTLLSDSWTTYEFDSSWQDLQEIRFFLADEAFGASIDNLIVSVVPIPAAFWLFGSAIAGLGFLRKHT